MSNANPAPQKPELEMSSDRTFGLVMCAFFSLIALYPLRHGHEPRLWAAIIAGSFLITSLVFARILHPLNRLWMQFGELLAKVISPIAMGIVYFGVITPLALVMRLFGKRPLELSPRKDLASYWQTREPPGPDPQSMKDQF